MKKEFEPVSILIRVNEKNKNEIIYNNIIDKMNIDELLELLSIIDVFYINRQ